MKMYQYRFTCLAIENKWFDKSRHELTKQIDLFYVRLPSVKSASRVASAPMWKCGVGTIELKKINEIILCPTGYGLTFQAMFRIAYHSMFESETVLLEQIDQEVGSETARPDPASDNGQPS